MNKDNSTSTTSSSRNTSNKTCTRLMARLSSRHIHLTHHTSPRWKTCSRVAPSQNKADLLALRRHTLKTTAQRQNGLLSLPTAQGSTSMTHPAALAQRRLPSAAARKHLLACTTTAATRQSTGDHPASWYPAPASAPSSTSRPMSLTILLLFATNRTRAT